MVLRKMMFSGKIFNLRPGGVGQVPVGGSGGGGRCARYLATQTRNLPIGTELNPDLRWR